MTYTFKSRHEIENLRIPVTGSVTINSGKGISDAELLEGRALSRIYIPATWNATTAPTLSLSVSEDGTTFRQLYYWSAATPATAVLASVTVATGKAYALPEDWTIGAHSVKIVSGTVATTTPIAKNRIVGLVYRLV
jgi:hypothetical protein